MMTINDFVKEALKRGIDVRVFISTGDHLGYELMGFYKSGSVKIRIADSPIYTIEVVTRYNEVTVVKSWDDVVKLNHKWWLYSRERYESWSVPDSAFAEDFERLELETA